MRSHSKYFSCLLFTLALCASAHVGPLLGQGNVGVNTSSPSTNLDVRPTGEGLPSLIQAASQDNAYFVRLFSGFAPAPDASLTWPTGGGFVLGSVDAPGTNFSLSTSFDSVGRVGIGTFSPQARLDLVPYGDSSEVLRIQSERPWVLRSRGSGVDTRLSLQSEVNFKHFDIRSENGDRAADFLAGNGSSEVLLVPDGGKVGIGVDEVDATLEISGGRWNLAGGNQGDLRIGDNTHNVRFGIATGGGGAGIARIFSSKELRLGRSNTDDMTIDELGKVGIGTTGPDAKLDVNGRIKVGDDESTPVPGAIRYNTEKQDFEGYNGTEWKSFTTGGSQAFASPTNGPASLVDYQEFDWPGAESFTSSIEVGSVHTICGDSVARKAIIYSLSGSEWGLDQVVAPSDVGNAEKFGKSVTTSGDWAAIGAPGGVVSGVQQGKVYVFRKVGGTWSQVAILTDPEGQAGDEFGYAVSMFNSDLLVGAPGANIGGEANHGKAVFFRLDGNWNYFGDYPQAADDNNRFGSSVAMAASFCAIGAEGTTIIDSVPGTELFCITLPPLLPGQPPETSCIEVETTVAVASCGGAKMVLMRKQAFGSNFIWVPDLEVEGCDRGVDVTDEITYIRRGIDSIQVYQRTAPPAQLQLQFEDKTGQFVVLGSGKMMRGEFRQSGSQLDKFSILDITGQGMPLMPEQIRTQLDPGYDLLSETTTNSNFAINGDINEDDRIAVVSDGQIYFARVIF